MDFVANTPETDVQVILEPTKQAFAKVQEKNRAKIESVERKTFKYGATDRHQLDVYYPSSTASSKAPILIFVYGGGLFSGDRVLAKPYDILYKNVGAFFSERGFLTIVPDYRLVPAGATYPQPVEDVRDALAFAVANLGDVGDTDRVFLLSHSAGSTIVSSLLLHEPAILSDDLLGHVKGAALMGGAYTFPRPPAPLPPVMAKFYGPAITENEPLALLRNAPDKRLSSLPPLLIFWSEKEMEGLRLGNVAFVELLRERTGKDVQGETAKGHNHVSPHWALCSGEGEEWGENVAEWFKERA